MTNWGFILIKFSSRRQNHLSHFQHPVNCYTQFVVILIRIHYFPLFEYRLWVTGTGQWWKPWIEFLVLMNEKWNSWQNCNYKRIQNKICLKKNTWTCMHVILTHHIRWLNEENCKVYLRIHNYNGMFSYILPTCENTILVSIWSLTMSPSK